MSLKILYTADMHLGMAFNNRGYPEAVREQLVEARFETLARIVELANSEQCALLVIAGDLFHRPNIAAATITRTLNILERFRGCTALLPGNHDYYDPEGPLWRSLRSEGFDELVLLTAEQPFPLRDYGLDAILYPAPCNKKHSSANRIGWIDPPSERPADCYHIGVAHGAVQGISPDLEDQYFPMTTSELSALKMHHWFLGHAHARYPDCAEASREPFLISGTPEPDGFDCRHNGYVWLTELNDEKDSRSRSIETGFLRFREIEKQLYSAATGAISDLLRAALFEAGGVSLEELEEAILKEEAELLSNWDPGLDGPRGGRGIDNPHKTKVGKILEAYYNFETVHKKLKSARHAEDEVDELNRRLADKTAERERLKVRLSEMETLEEDIRRRSTLEPQLETARVKEAELKAIAKKWPGTEEKVKNLEAKIANEKQRIDSAEKELKEAESVLAARKKKELLERARPLHEKSSDLQQQLTKPPPGLSTSFPGKNRSSLLPAIRKPPDCSGAV